MEERGWLSVGLEMASPGLPMTARKSRKNLLRHQFVGRFTVAGLILVARLGRPRLDTVIG
jgi:hypothetical protein